eukprot:1162027-Pelagomonas_calceolata.AAC.6
MKFKLLSKKNLEGLANGVAPETVSVFKTRFTHLGQLTGHVSGMSQRLPVCWKVPAQAYQSIFAAAHQNM